MLQRVQQRTPHDGRRIAREPSALIDGCSTPCGVAQAGFSRSIPFARRYIARGVAAIESVVCCAAGASPASLSERLQRKSLDERDVIDPKVEADHGHGTGCAHQHLDSSDASGVELRSRKRTLF